MVNEMDKYKPLSKSKTISIWYSAIILIGFILIYYLTFLLYAGLPAAIPETNEVIFISIFVGLIVFFVNTYSLYIQMSL